jgi:hypothetical protein
MGDQWTAWRSKHPLAPATDFSSVWVPSNACSVMKSSGAPSLSQFNFGPLMYGTPALFGINNPEPFAFLAAVLKAGSAPTVYLVFRGTKTDADLATDRQYAQVPYTDPGGKGTGNVDKGFSDLFSTMSDAITSQLQSLYSADNATQLVITGHSLGSTLATFSVPIACSIGFSGLHYNQGCPRVGDPTFVSYINSLAIPTFRLVNIEDIVPTVPPPEAPVQGATLIYQHAGTPVSFSAQYGSVPANHDPCCSYGYAIFNSESPMNPDPSSCTSGN